MKPCTLGKRHKWEFVRTVISQKVRVSAKGTTATLSMRGVYQCPCGEKKLGPAGERT